MRLDVPMGDADGSQIVDSLEHLEGVNFNEVLGDLLALAGVDFGEVVEGLLVVVHHHVQVFLVGLFGVEVVLDLEEVRVVEHS